MEEKTKFYGIYKVTEEYKPDGSYAGFRCSVTDSIGKKQGKLYLKSDGTENYRSKPEAEDDDLEI
jgi:hypothetical protein